MLASVAICAIAARENGHAALASIADGGAAIPVYPDDITDRPYKVVGEVRAAVATPLFGKHPSQDKIFAELWVQARKLGADAVVKATYRDAPKTAFGWGKIDATGTAIKFTPPCTRSSPGDPLC